MAKVNVLMKANARPRACAKLLAGETYTLPKAIAKRLVAIGKAEIVADDDQAHAKVVREPKKAKQADD